MEEEITAGNTGSNGDVYVRPDAPEFNFDTEIKEEAAATEQAQEQESSNTAAAESSTPSPKSQPAGENTEGEGGFLDSVVEMAGGNEANPFINSKTSVVAGTYDFGVDLVNTIAGTDFEKPTEFENTTHQAIRDISSVVVPTIFGGMALKGLGVAANARVGWSIGQSPFVQRMGAMGADALAGLAVGSVSSEYEDHNILGKIKRNFPVVGDYIPDSLATLDSDSPDEKRIKNIKEDILVIEESKATCIR